MLKNVPNELKTSCDGTSIVLSEYLVLNGVKIPIKAKLRDDCYNEGNFIGTFIFKEISFETENKYNFKNKEFEYYKTVNGESIKIGTFITTEVKDSDTKETVKVIGMDYGLKTQVEYSSVLDYSSGTVTLQDVWNECCTLAGLESGISTFTNSDFVVDGDQFTGTGATIRDVFVGIAMSSGNFVKVMNDDKIYLVFTEETNDIIEDYTELDDKRDTHPITCVRLGVSQIEGEFVELKDEELVNEYGENWLIINDNPFAYTEEKRTQLIEAILNKVKGFGYSSFKSETSFKPYYTCGDLIQFRNKEGNLVKSIILRYMHDFDKITLEAPSIIKATVDYVMPIKPIDIIKTIEIRVNKDRETIESLVTTTENINDTLTEIGTKQTQNQENFEYSINQLTEIVESNNENIQGEIDAINGSLAEGTHALKNTLVTIDINGIQVATNTSAISTLMSNSKFAIQNSGRDMFYVGYNDKTGRVESRIEYLEVTDYLIAGNHRVEKYEDRTGWFYVGGN